MRDLDETTCRRPDFVGGEPVLLANDQVWHLPRVLVRLETRLGTSGPVPVPIWSVGDGPTDQAFEDAMQQALDGFIESPGRPVGQQAVIDLATVLLRRNYNASVEAYDWLVFEGFYRQARRDSRFLGMAAEATTTIMQVGFKDPLDRADRLTRGLPPHRGQSFDVGSN